MPATIDFASRRVWIDLALALSGIAFAAKGLPVVGLPLLLLALVAPVLRLRQSRRGEALLGMVPSDLADAYRDLVGAATLPGVLDGAEAVEAANDCLLEVAVLLVGQPPKGAAQRRFVAARLTVMRETTALLRERHDAVVEAMHELETLVPVHDPITVPGRNSLMVRLMALALMPAFIAWDIVLAAGRAVLLLLEGIALRIRATARLGLNLLHATTRVLDESRRAWRSMRLSLTEAATDARRSATSLRLQTRLQIRQLRRRAIR